MLRGLEESGDRQVAADVGLGVGRGIGRCDLDRGRTRAGSLAEVKALAARPLAEIRAYEQPRLSPQLMHL